MKTSITFFTLLFLLSTRLFAQQVDTSRVDTTQAVQTQVPEEPNATTESKVFYGGSLGLSFGSYFRINVAPMVGFKLSPKTAAGVKVAYEYTEDTRSAQKVTGSNYGGSVFMRYRIIPRAYLHGEFAYMSYQYSSGNVSSERQWVPFLLLGGGVVQPIGSNASAFIEILFDVLQDSHSPYEDWTPIINVGVGVGF